jgi:hypothetical protein
MSEQRQRTPDSDLRAYLAENADIYTLEDIANIHAEVPGHNDADYWYWVIELRDGRFVLTRAWCDETGWDCQSGGESQVAATALLAAELAPEAENATGRRIRRNLVAQVQGTQPFGLEVREAE